MSAKRLLRGVVVVGAVFALPTATAVTLVLSFDRLGSEPRPVADDLPGLGELVPVGAAEIRDQRPAELELTWVEGNPVRAPELAGLVTHVEVEPGNAIRSGTWLLEVSGVRRVGYVGARPFWRPVTATSSRAEINQLAELLVDMGYLAEGTDQFSGTVRRAVEQLEIDAGIAPTGEFDPSMGIWLGTEDPVVVHTIDVSVGQPFPSPGEPIFHRRPSLATAQVMPGDTGGSGALVNPVAGERVFVLDGEAFEFDTTLNGVAAEALPSLAEAIDPAQTTIAGTTQLAEELVAQTVPVSAVVVIDSGKACVLLSEPRSAPLDERVRRVDVVASDGGIAQLTPDLEPETHVVASLGPTLRDEVAHLCSS